GARPRPSCHNAAPARLRSREADLSIRRPRLPVDRRSRPSGEGNDFVGQASRPVSAMTGREACPTRNSRVSASPVRATVDFGKPGKQYGHLFVPYSHNLGGWANLMLPVAV